ncbi:MAG: hypothetical protein Kow0080_05060 [Candidatus Promineifilaceae bacterium]
MSQFELNNCVVSIRDANDRHLIVGTGFVISQMLLLTSAHVIKNAHASLHGEVKVQFKATDSFDTAVVTAWAEKEDIALLTLKNPIPQKVQIASLVQEDTSNIHNFCSFGYPEALNKETDGFPLEGKITGDTKHKQNGHKLLALQSQGIDQGISGAPVFDTKLNGVVGIISHKTKHDFGPNRDTAVAVPASVIQKCFPKYIPLNPQAQSMPDNQTPHTSTFIPIPGGPFQMGSAPDTRHAKPNETPLRQEAVDTFCIAKYPVTNEEYARFVEAANHPAPAYWVNGRPPAEKSDHPVVEISWDDAQAYCKWLSQQTGHPFRLPTEAEWEKAARGTADARIYSWGNTWEKFRCNSSEDDLKETTPVTRFEGWQKNPYDVADMLGNVWEWTATPYEPYPGSEHVTLLGTGKRYVVRGGSFINDGSNCRVAVRGRYAPTIKRHYLGFRIASSQPLSSIEPIQNATVTNRDSTNPAAEETIIASNNRRSLRKKLEEHFSLAELNNIASDLGLKPDNFTQKLNVMARELIAECQQRGITPKLIDLLKRERSHVSWEEEK